jgi:hypothetical protein
MVQLLLRTRAMLAHMPSLDALESDDNDRLAAKLQLARLRSQVAVVQTICDEVGHLARPRDADGLRAQLVEEMARLGWRLLEEAASLTEPPRSEDSGVFTRRPSLGSPCSRVPSPALARSLTFPQQ